ncbi:hypothetical protein J4418_03995 [Candidatus Woesearchaeota archaeon]|nr:hypothetical protein [Candidatus Woesearchaeota archaeon]
MISKDELQLWVTLWPSFSHYPNFARDSQISAIRLNSAMITPEQLPKDLQLANNYSGIVPLYFDIKGRQLRVVDVIPRDGRVHIVLNHSIEVKTPTKVIFKAGNDWGRLIEVKNGNCLIIEIVNNGNECFPKFNIIQGESIHIFEPSLKVKGDVFSTIERHKIQIARTKGIDRFFLSYVETQKELDEFQELVGQDSEIIAKIENKAGLEFVANEFKKRPNLSLMAARGDLYLELDRFHDIIPALKLIIGADPEASVGSRFMLSIMPRDPLKVNGISDDKLEINTPECSDFLEIAWLWDLGYRRMMFCDSLCLKRKYLAFAVKTFCELRDKLLEK